MILRAVRRYQELEEDIIVSSIFLLTSYMHLVVISVKILSYAWLVLGMRGMV